MDWETLYQRSKKLGSLLDDEIFVVSMLENATVHFWEEADLISHRLFLERIYLLRNLCRGESSVVTWLISSPLLDELCLLGRHFVLQAQIERSEENATAREVIDATMEENCLYTFSDRYSLLQKQQVIGAVAQLFANLTSNASSRDAALVRLIALPNQRRNNGSISDIVAAATMLRAINSFDALWATLRHTTISRDTDQQSSTLTCLHPVQVLCDSTVGSLTLRQLILLLRQNMDHCEGAQLFIIHLLREQHKQQQLQQMNASESVETTSLPLRVYRALGSSGIDISWEQTLFAFVLSSVLEDPTTASSMSLSLRIADLALDLGTHLCSTILSSEEVQRRLTRGSNGSSSVASEESLQTERAFSQLQGKWHCDFVLAALQCLSALCAHLSLSEANTDEVLHWNRVSRRVLPLLFVAVIRNRDPVSRRAVEPATERASTSPVEGDEELQWVRAVVRQSLQLLGAVCTVSAEARDLVLARSQTLFQLMNEEVSKQSEPQNEELQGAGLLCSLLQHCVTDFENPLAREWALFAVRQLCSLSPAACTAIQQMQPQRLVDIVPPTAMHDSLPGDSTLREQLSQAGVSLQLDVATGKLVARNASRESE